MISVIIPTIAGREHHLERCLDAYQRNTARPFEVIVVSDRPTCGIAWNDGLADARGDYLHLSADDLEPHPGWDDAAVACVERGQLPCPRIVNADGTLQSCGDRAKEAATGSMCDVARVPFFPRLLLDAVFPIIATHYMTDYWVTARAERAGWPTVVVREMCFTHHLAAEGRLDTMDEDIASYYMFGSA